MLGVVLKGHDYNYEVAELLKLFTTQFKFVDSKDVGMILENTVIVYNDNVFSKTVYCENYQVKFEHLDNRSIKGLTKQEVKKITKETIKRSMFNVLMKIFNSYVPWGILTGIRPVKIVHKLLDNGLDDESIRENLKKNYLISDEKIDLALEIAKRERLFIYPIDKNKISLYVSIPFCPTRCLYCSFPANPLKQFGHLKREYVYKLIEEIKGLSKLLEETNKEIETLYIGGGTPTTLDEEEMDLLINSLFKELDLTKIKEFTVEAGRPDSITRGKLEVLKKHNVTRISINPQTMNDSTLVKIGREHKVSDIVDCFNMARELGFDNINMDLILGLMDEDLAMVENTLKKIEKLSPESLTVHTLAIKRASNLKENIDKYHLTQYEEMVKMIDLSMKYAKKMGLNPYYMYRQKHMLGNLENIGYAKEGYECIYNMQIMEEKQSNYALGAGAISKFVYVDEDRIERVDNVKNVEQYIARVQEMVDRKKEEVNKNAN
ncbi:coproporphyrinogen dehydrogenase HemZ [Asaccharospora irregularis]|uniref:Oxygen-independent coproporphyrinogen-3 oxidase n=1 Tax=Asaccharospora irregularis DSM 2635 TaxID=1121321 RepID=A0A1M5J744_9FIRM|nr:coproporphyrinogen dehydrogenase HemZ [Asaccharospora irregularis]SHG36407.1 oxygen-independent coproporphyrinogen-3 oxidase [Asaccharospora irregularis DSM 2635]